jgi:hypothetical protein
MSDMAGMNWQVVRNQDLNFAHASLNSRISGSMSHSQRGTSCGNNADQWTSECGGGLANTRVSG